MPEYRLKYEFAYLEQAANGQFNNEFPGLTSLGTINNAHIYDLTENLTDPDGIVMNFGEAESGTDVENQLSSVGFERGIINQLEVSGIGYKYVRDWLIDNEDASINMLRVKITDVVCNQSRGVWQVTSDNLTWCDEEECKLSFSLVEYRPLLNCLQNTLIHDNWNNWFPDDGIPFGKAQANGDIILDAHLWPRFRYCDDIKPQALQNFLFFVAQNIIFAFFTLVSGLLAIANIIGGNFADTVQEKFDNMISGFVQNILGCARMHPAPFVRGYFINACGKCGYTFRSDIFNNPDSAYNMFYDTAILAARGTKGYKILEGEELIDFRVWISDNALNETVPTLAFSLKDAFNAKYGLDNGEFYFEPKNKFPDTIVFDFTGADKELLITPICYSWNAEKKYASTLFEYATDANDQAGNEALHRYNNANRLHSWTGGLENNRYEGIREIKVAKYSVARFANDGIDQKKIFTVGSGTAYEATNGWVSDVLLLQKDVTSLPKLMSFDGLNKADAAALRFPVSEYEIDYWKNDWVYANTPPGYSVFNWPLYWFPEGEMGGMTKNLYSLHKIDDPTKSDVQNKTWSLAMELCCETMERLVEDDVAGDGVFAHLDYLVQLPPTASGLQQKGNIRTVVLDYVKNEIRLSGDIKYT